MAQSTTTTLIERSARNYIDHRRPHSRILVDIQQHIQPFLLALLVRDAIDKFSFARALSILYVTHHSVYNISIMPNSRHSTNCRIVLLHLLEYQEILPASLIGHTIDILSNYTSRLRHDLVGQLVLERIETILITNMTPNSANSKKYVMNALTCYVSALVRCRISQNQSISTVVHESLHLSLRHMANPNFAFTLLSHWVICISTMMNYTTTHIAKYFQVELAQYLKNALEENRQETITHILFAARHLFDSLTTQSDQVQSDVGFYELWLKSFIHVDTLSVLSIKKYSTAFFTALDNMLMNADIAMLRVHRRVFLPHLVPDTNGGSTRPQLIEYIEALRLQMAKLGEASDIDYEKLDNEIIDVLKSFSIERKIPPRVFNWSIARSIFFRKEFLPRLLVFRDRRSRKDIGIEGQLDGDVLEAFVINLKNKGKISNSIWREWLSNENERKRRAQVATPLSGQYLSQLSLGSSSSVLATTLMMGDLKGLEHANIVSLFSANPDEMLVEVSVMLNTLLSSATEFVTEILVEDKAELIYRIDVLCMSVMVNEPVFIVEVIPGTTYPRIYQPTPHHTETSIINVLVNAILEAVTGDLSRCQMACRIIEESCLLQYAIFGQLYDMIHYNGILSFERAFNLGKALFKLSNYHMCSVSASVTMDIVASFLNERSLTCGQTMIIPFIDTLASHFMMSPLNSAALSVLDAVMVSLTMHALVEHDVVFRSPFTTQTEGLPWPLIIKSLLIANWMTDVDTYAARSLLDNVRYDAPNAHIQAFAAYWAATADAQVASTVFSALFNGISQPTEWLINLVLIRAYFENDDAIPMRFLHTLVDVVDTTDCGQALISLAAVRNISSTHTVCEVIVNIYQQQKHVLSIDVLEAFTQLALAVSVIPSRQQNVCEIVLCMIQVYLPLESICMIEILSTFSMLTWHIRGDHPELSGLVCCSKHGNLLRLQLQTVGRTVEAYQRGTLITYPIDPLAFSVIMWMAISDTDVANCVHESLSAYLHQESTPNAVSILFRCLLRLQLHCEQSCTPFVVSKQTVILFCTLLENMYPPQSVSQPLAWIPQYTPLLCRLLALSNHAPSYAAKLLPHIPQDVSIQTTDHLDRLYLRSTSLQI